MARVRQQTFGSAKGVLFAPFRGKTQFPRETEVGEIFEEPMKIAGLWRSRDTPFLGEPSMRTISLRMSYSDLVPFTFAGFREIEGSLGLEVKFGGEE